MKIYDFDAAFERYLKRWMTGHADAYGGNVDKLEELVPDIYMAYLSEPLADLDGLSPEAYFEQFSDPEELVAALLEYMAKGVPLPDLLMERIAALGEVSEPALLALFLDTTQPESVRMTAVSLLQEIGSRAPLEHYADLIMPLEEPSDLGDICAESLAAMGDEAVEPILARYEQAGAAAKNIFADVLCNFKGNDRIYEILLERFLTQEDQKALFASYLSKYGDERALPALVKACEDPDLGYLDFLEIANAIEALGGDRPAEREYSGDPYYEAMSQMGMD